MGGGGKYAGVGREQTRGSALAQNSWARAQGYCKRGSGGQRKVEKIRATFWDSKVV